MRSKTVILDGPVHYLDTDDGEGPPNGAPILLVHGLGGSHVNWSGVASQFSRHARVVVIDLVGFGHTPLAGRSSSVEANRQMLHRFIHEVCGGRAVLVGNSMGGLLSMMQASAAPETVDRLVLVSPPVPRPPGVPLDREVATAFVLYMIPLLGTLVLRRRVANMTPEEMSRDLMRLCCVDPSRVPPEVFASHVRMNRARREMPWTEAAYLGAARSLVRMLARRQAFSEMVRAIRAPTLLLQGDGDRLVPHQAAREVARSRPDWTFHLIAGVGHIPQMEVPDVFVQIVERFLAQARA